MISSNIRTSFSTVACPDWTLRRVAEMAGKYDFDGVELRTFGFGSRQFVCDPALTAAEKTRAMFQDAGVRIVGLGSSLRFDDPVRPRVIGRVIADQERAVRQTQRLIALADEIGCPLVRVFAFEVPTNERRSRTIDLIAERLRKVSDSAEKTGVRIALENGGSFRTSQEILEVLDRVDSRSGGGVAASRILGVSYSVAVAHKAGEDPVRGIEALGSRLFATRLKDLRGPTPVIPGDGDVPCRAVVQSLAQRGRAGEHVVFEWDRAWLEGLAGPDEVLPEANRRISSWSQIASPTRELAPALA
jgi:sugar phosphate isomerase/epimerase